MSFKSGTTSAPVSCTATLGESAIILWGLKWAMERLTWKDNNLPISPCYSCQSHLGNGHDQGFRCLTQQSHETSQTLNHPRRCFWIPDPYRTGAHNKGLLSYVIQQIIILIFLNTVLISVNTRYKTISVVQRWHQMTKENVIRNRNGECMVSFSQMPKIKKSYIINNESRVCWHTL